MVKTSHPSAIQHGSLESHVGIEHWNAVEEAEELNGYGLIHLKMYK